jgi:hypothetical protein
MIKRPFVQLLAVLVFVFVFSGNSSAKVLTATPPKPSGTTISPASAQIELQGAEVQHPLQFKITNNESEAQTINISTADFNTLGESGGLAFVGTNPTAIQKKYGLATWVALPQNTITVQPKQTTTINAYIQNQPNMSPGGHYGALMLAISTPGSGSKDRVKVALHPIASSLLFVNKIGGDTHTLKLTNVMVAKNPFKLPGSVTLRFKNDGNTHLVPRGVVSITSPNGKLISRGVINEDSGLVLPETYRRFSVPLKTISPPLRPGKYTLRVDFRFDGYNNFRSYQSKILLLTPLVLIEAILVLGAAAAAAYFVASKKHVKARFAKILKRLRTKLKR